MVTVQIQIHQAADGTTFASRDELNIYNQDVFNRCYHQLKDIVSDYIADDSDITDVLQMLLSEKKQIANLLKQMI